MKKLIKLALYKIGLYYTISLYIINSKEIISYIISIPGVLRNYLRCRRYAEIFNGKLVGLLHDNAIGPYIMFSEYYMRYCEVLNYNPKKDLVLIGSDKPVNKEFLAMLQDKTTVISDSKLHKTIENGGNLWLRRMGIYINDDVPSAIKNGFIFYPGSKNNFDLSSSQIERAKKLLTMIGFDNNKKFVTVHNNDEYYWKSRGINNGSNDSYRYSKSENLGLACDYLKERNIQVVRAGHFYRNIFDDINIMELDHHDKELIDLYIQKECLFAVCGGSGIAFIPYLFKKPILYHNFIPMGESPTIERGILIPKLILDKKTEKILSIRELLRISEKLFFHQREKLMMVNVTADSFQRDFLYKKNSLKPLENSREDILQGFLEMELYVSGHLVLSEEQFQLQERFKECFPLKHPIRRSPNFHISPSFLDRNKFLID